MFYFQVKRKFLSHILLWHFKTGLCVLSSWWHKDSEWRVRWKLCAWSFARATESHAWFFLKAVGISGTSYQKLFWPLARCSLFTANYERGGRFLLCGLLYHSCVWKFKWGRDSPSVSITYKQVLCDMGHLWLYFIVSFRLEIYVQNLLLRAQSEGRKPFIDSTFLCGN